MCVLISHLSISKSFLNCCIGLLCKVSGIKVLWVTPVYLATVTKDVDEAEKEGRPIEVVVFVVDPTRLSALMQLASYSKSTKGPASVAPFGHACQQIYAIPRAEGESDDPRGVIGMTDMYARRYVGLDQMTYAVPYNLYKRMVSDIPGSFLEDEKYLTNMEKSLRIHQDE